MDSDKKGKAIFIYWSRWLILLPMSFIAGILATFPLHWILYMIFATTSEPDLGSIGFFLSLFPNGVNLESVEYLLSPLVISYTYIIVGYKMAPKYKFKSAVVLFCIYLISWMVVCLIALSKTIVGNFHTEFHWRAILGLLGAIIGLGHLYFLGHSKKKGLDGKS